MASLFCLKGVKHMTTTSYIQEGAGWFSLLIHPLLHT
jgi:hypothetical protein